MPETIEFVFTEKKKGCSYSDIQSDLRYQSWNEDEIKGVINNADNVFLKSLIVEKKTMKGISNKIVAIC